MDGSTGELKMEEFTLLLLLSFGELGLTLPIWGSTILYDCLRELIESSAVQVIKTMRKRRVVHGKSRKTAALKHFQCIASVSLIVCVCVCVYVCACIFVVVCLCVHGL